MPLKNYSYLFDPPDKNPVMFFEKGCNQYSFHFLDLMLINFVDTVQFHACYPIYHLYLVNVSVCYEGSTDQVGDKPRYACCRALRLLPPLSGKVLCQNKFQYCPCLRRPS